jgi:hypothetical protein
MRVRKTWSATDTTSLPNEVAAPNRLGIGATGKSPTADCRFAVASDPRASAAAVPRLSRGMTIGGGSGGGGQSLRFFFGAETTSLNFATCDSQHESALPNQQPTHLTAHDRRRGNTHCLRARRNAAQRSMAPRQVQPRPRRRLRRLLTTAKAVTCIPSVLMRARCCMLHHLADVAWRHAASSLGHCTDHR